MHGGAWMSACMQVRSAPVTSARFAPQVNSLITTTCGEGIPRWIPRSMPHTVLVTYGNNKVINFHIINLSNQWFLVYTVSRFKKIVERR